MANWLIAQHCAHRTLQALAATLALMFATQTCLAHEDGTTLAGWAEPVSFQKLQLSLKAKLDTGARTSSLNASSIKLFQKDGEQWVRFAVPRRDGATRKFERPLHRMSRVRRAGTAPELRPVILLEACVAGIRRIAEFNLRDRSGMRYPVLIGRSYLRGDILVSSNAENLHDGECPAR